jgi:hypothetical protein
MASAQEPKAVKTVKVTQSLNDTALYEVKDDGMVLIDWDEVESLAASKQNPILRPQAQVMLAIRDRKMEGEGSSEVTVSRLLITALATLISSPALAETIIGQASVIDGDTLEIHGQRIHL